MDRISTRREEARPQRRIPSAAFFPSDRAVVIEAARRFYRLGAGQAAERAGVAAWR
jgi:hemin uptake protein HemP